MAEVHSILRAVVPDHAGSEEYGLAPVAGIVLAQSGRGSDRCLADARLNGCDSLPMNIKVASPAAPNLHDMENNAFDFGQHHAALFALGH